MFLNFLREHFQVCDQFCERLCGADNDVHEAQGGEQAVAGGRVGVTKNDVAGLLAAAAWWRSSRWSVTPCWPARSLTTPAPDRAVLRALAYPRAGLRGAGPARGTVGFRADGHPVMINPAYELLFPAL